MGADVGALLWEGIPGIGMRHGGGGDTEKEGKPIHIMFLRWSPPGKGSMHSGAPTPHWPNVAINSSILQGPWDVHQRRAP